MDKETKKIADEIYAVGFRNGQIDMKNRVLKKINRDWSLVTMTKPFEAPMRIMRMINRIKVSSVSVINK